jgi:S-DNA-T family DNA segregation ATPase FtsK/SpoIIIE
VDVKEACSKDTPTTKTSARFESVNRVLDAAAPSCAPLAARWDAEADRRRKLRTPEHLKALMDAQKNHSSARSLAARAKTDRTKARKDSKNPVGVARRAARVADKAARKGRATAQNDLKSARKNYPNTLANVAAKAHAGHAVPAALASYVLSTPQDWAMWPASVSAGLIALNAGALWIGRRAVTVAVDTEATAEERQLMERLDPSFWVQHADERGLSGTVTTPPKLTAAGVTTAVRLDGRWEPKDLKAKAGSVRALLGMRTETRMDITSGSQGDWARLLVRTRSASDGIPMTWTPEHDGIGVDEVTGDIVDIPLQPGLHILIAGVTGTGKSVSWRGLAMRAVRRAGWTAVVADPKRQEAIGWQHAVRTVGQERDRRKRMADLYSLVSELTAEMHRRQGIATGPTWKPDGKPENRKLLVIIDEGAALIRMAKQPEFSDVLDMLDELWSEARSVGFQFVWATQVPTKQGGVPPLVKDNMSVRVALTTGAGEHERAVFGENAQQTGWVPSTLDGIPGRAMVQHRKRKPDPVGLWHVTDEAIAALPSADPWHSPGAAPTPESAPAAPRLTLVKAEPAPRTEAPSLTDTEAAVLDAVQSGATRQKDVVETSGIPKGTVSKAVRRLVEAGHLVKTEDGALTTTAKEETA